MGHRLKRPLNVAERYILYGLVGFACEVCFTATFEVAIAGNRKLIGVTSVYVFFVYATAILVIERIYLRISKILPYLPLRALIYTLVCYFWEFSSGFMLKRVDACPWDYSSYFDYHFMGLITFEYLPLWFVATMFGERLVVRKALSLAFLVEEQTFEDVARAELLDTDVHQD
ncbi:unnamed protein product [Caenorhabditis auriculariae]|uniref:Uncharacterized protein n=1 Tax=Caenorhabditis auriculariae TaxID=2777116 RepID=A0A8S1H6N9_9PELO|nr:unnamed protein product [Caenorhabditis auriculariae]